jgi:hypothetical protein
MGIPCLVRVNALLLQFKFKALLLEFPCTVVRFMPVIRQCTQQNGIKTPLVILISSSRDVLNLSKLI